MKLQIRVDENGIISDVKFKTFGCGSAIASSSYMTERVKGLSLEKAGEIKNTEIAKELCLPPVKLHCSSLFSYFSESRITKKRSQCWRRMPFNRLSVITALNDNSQGKIRVSSTQLKQMARLEHQQLPKARSLRFTIDTFRPVLFILVA